MIETPQSFVVSTECQKAAEQHGFRRALGEENGWAAFQSTTAQGTIWLASIGVSGPWFLAIDHAGVVEELGVSPTEMPGPGLAQYTFDSLGLLYTVLSRIYQLAASLPDAPLREFRDKTNGLPQTTEAERLIIQRVGQDIFRARLMDYWQGHCPLTGITDPALLRASHIIPWSECDSDAERLDVHNGLLLSALWDAAFDRALVAFGDDGQPQFSPNLSVPARAELRWRGPLLLTAKHRARLAWHRTHRFRTAIA
ncbi:MULTISPECIES: HNH endonuclease [Pseudomonadota]|uniref:HNH endonuclease n=1 Tax=Pseudomonadota TaxID=1224 RepID=UPI00272FF271|nr:MULTISPECIES: HNH endonuclease [Pseudomonadota]MDP1627649.1 HNH endonuclease [Parvibaculum sp.]MDP2243751.1 HNH endonuclease [Pseudomonas sp.]